ncbi:MAG: PQQ-binding-like beta-propeller repeat protein [Pirellulales bacterium]|nr:PQQ-binding-like beta-propeller repeat protein [Pirellulales bacterium]
MIVANRAILWASAATVCALFAADDALAMADDWPQILGPSRNGIALGESIIRQFPDTGPEVLWSRSVGKGVAGVAVAGDRVVLFHRHKQGDRAECMEKATGNILWRSDVFGTRYQSAILDDNGPRCVPVISDGRVFLYSANGDLHCLNLEDGKALWTRQLAVDYATNAELGYFGAGSSPIVSQGKLWVNLGGARAEAGIVALDPKTGETLWKGTREQASYSSPVATKIDGKARLLFVTRMNLLSLDPATMAIDWRVPFGQRGPTVNGANPIISDDHVFVTAAYGVGGKCLKLSLQEPAVVWENDDVMSSQFTTPIVIGGTAYGVDGRHDLGVARLRCFNPLSGKIFWTQENFGKATLILADGKLLALTTDGKLVIAEPDQAAYRELAAAKVMDSRCLALPALSGGLFFVRDQNQLKCLDLRPGKPDLIP